MINKEVSRERDDMILLLGIVGPVDLWISYLLISTDIIVSFDPFYDRRITPKCRISIHFEIVLQLLLQDDKAQKIKIMD